LEQLDDEGLDDFTRVRELLGIAAGKDNGWSNLRIGELKSMLALAGNDLEQALIWVEWTQDFNASIFTAERANYYRCLQTLL
ncbi:30S ribosomal protein S12 methylthiotransferase accessory protein YcaO, partial [Xenorhabdus bovienii]|nr:30S ribosomal protein S12 methylthiotransferase accessory protein YcaO [Xenorhabdus bovienii]